MENKLPPAVQSILDSAMGLLDRAIHEAGEQPIADYLYREFVRIDIPLVPEQVEVVVVDPFVKPWINRFVQQVHARVHKDEPTV